MENEQELPEYLVKQIEEVAEAARLEGQTIEISDVLPSVTVTRAPDDWYHFQEWEADELLERVPPNVDREDYILWSAQSW